MRGSIYPGTEPRAAIIESLYERMAREIEQVEDVRQ